MRRLILILALASLTGCVTRYRAYHPPVVPDNNTVSAYCPQQNCPLPPPADDPPPQGER